MSRTNRGVVGRQLGISLPITGASFSDSHYNVAVNVNGIACFRPSTMGVLRLSVGVGCTQVVVFAPNNVFGITTTDDAMSLYVDGVYSGSGIPTAQGMAGYVFLLDGQPHLVEIYSPYQQFDATTVGNILGSFIFKVQCYGGPVSILPNPSVTKRWAGYGDSIMSTALAIPDSRFGYVPILRQPGNYAGRLSVEAWGGRSLWDDGGNGGWGFSSYNQLATQMLQLVFDATTIQIWDAMGFNDYGMSRWSAASYGAACGTFYDQLHGQQPAAQIFAQTLLITGLESTPNTFGDVPPDYRAAKAAAAATRPFVTLVPGPSLMSVGNLSADGIHPNNAGHAQLATNIGAML
jgi:hypothetical protein